MNKIFILRPKKGCDDWEPWYDKAFGFIVFAENEKEARELADKEAGDENGWGDHKRNPWLDEKKSTCEKLKAGEKSEVIMRDFASA